MEKISLDFSGINSFITKEEIEKFEKKVININKELEEKKDIQEEMLGWLNIFKNYKDEEIKDIIETANNIKEKAEVFVVIGIGGSYLGARAVIEMFKKYFGKDKKHPEILFAGNNMSGAYLEDLLAYIKDKDVYINVISKSGKTLEPAITFRALKAFLEEKYGDFAKERITVTTDKEKGILKEIANKYGYKSFIIPDNVGGRYSVLTPVGLLPIAVSGIDIRQILLGMEYAKNVYNINDFEQNDCFKYAVIRNILHKKGKDIEIFANFEPKMHYFVEWVKQLLGESEGKNGKGIFPTGVDYSTDLHSLGQMIQEGKRNIFETNLNVINKKNSYKVTKSKDNLDKLDYLVNVKLDDINEKAYLGTLKAHVDGSVPNIIINIPEINEFVIGQLIFFFEKSCAISAKILGVNPFNQPGVEAYKTNMMQLINKYNK